MYYLLDLKMKISPLLFVFLLVSCIVNEPETRLQHKGAVIEVEEDMSENMIRSFFDTLDIGNYKQPQITLHDSISVEIAKDLDSLTILYRALRQSSTKEDKEEISRQIEEYVREVNQFSPLENNYRKRIDQIVKQNNSLSKIKEDFDLLLKEIKEDTRLTDIEKENLLFEVTLSKHSVLFWLKYYTSQQ